MSETLPGRAGLGEVRQRWARHSEARRGKAWDLFVNLAGRGEAERGTARLGEARQGKAGPGMAWVYLGNRRSRHECARNRK